MVLGEKLFFYLVLRISRYALQNLIGSKKKLLSPKSHYSLGIFKGKKKKWSLKKGKLEGDRQEKGVGKSEGKMVHTSFLPRERETGTLTKTTVWVPAQSHVHNFSIWFSYEAPSPVISWSWIWKQSPTLCFFPKWSEMWCKGCEQHFTHIHMCARLMLGVDHWAHTDEPLGQQWLLKSSGKAGRAMCCSARLNTAVPFLHWS